MSRILDLLGLHPSAQSTDYVQNKKQYHLHRLLTEQRHPATWNLSFAVRSDTAEGLRMLLAVDEDVSAKISALARNPALLRQAARAVSDAVRSGRRIYVYGCGATGRLAKQMESAFWRPFWQKAGNRSCWRKLERRVPANVGDLMVGEMTGADRALVSSLEGFEDLPLIGRLQLEDHRISRGDVVFCVTEGGETSSVIGTILAALEQYGPLDAESRREAREKLYFVYNNPDELLLPLERSASVLRNPAVTRINLATGPQAITGSTRMQATTIETFVIGVIFEEAIAQILAECLSGEEMRDLGFDPGSDLIERLHSFGRVREGVAGALDRMVRFGELEAETYHRGGRAFYYAKRALITVFIDSTERSPTFRLHPIDRAASENRRSWVQVWTDAEDAPAAWRQFLGRPFRGLDASFYRGPLERNVHDPYLREAALRSLADAGADQEASYDFSFSEANLRRDNPQARDLGIEVLLEEESSEARKSGSGFSRFAARIRESGAKLALLEVSRSSGRLLRADLPSGKNDVLVRLNPGPSPDPLTLRSQVALKMLLNAHSTGVMARLGRVVGNTMTSVSPSNLKLVGRATHLIVSHVNDVLNQAPAAGRLRPAGQVSFEEANAVLFDAIDYVRSREIGQTAETALSIIRIIETLHRGSRVEWDEAGAILDREGLDGFLMRHNPALRRTAPRRE